MNKDLRDRMLNIFDRRTRTNTFDEEGNEEARALFHLLAFVKTWPDADNSYEFTKAWRQADWSDAHIDCAIWNLLNSNAAKKFWEVFELCQGEKPS